jgi:four helix bundle protein
MDSDTPQFGHEKLDVYQRELEFITWATALLAEIRVDGVVTIREVRDQLDRASLSALLNTAEGNGKRQRQLRARYFDDARGSCAECAACLDALVAKGVCTQVRVRDGKLLLVRIGQMLTRLVNLYADPTTVREECTEYTTDP